MERNTLTHTEKMKMKKKIHDGDDDEEEFSVRETQISRKSIKSILVAGQGRGGACGTIATTYGTSVGRNLASLFS